MWGIKIAFSLGTEFSSLEQSWYFIGVYIVKRNTKEYSYTEIKASGPNISSPWETGNASKQFMWNAPKSSKGGIDLVIIKVEQSGRLKRGENCSVKWSILTLTSLSSPVQVQSLLGHLTLASSILRWHATSEKICKIIRGQKKSHNWRKMKWNIALVQWCRTMEGGATIKKGNTH